MASKKQEETELKNVVFDATWDAVKLMIEKMRTMSQEEQVELARNLMVQTVRATTEVEYKTAQEDPLSDIGDLDDITPEEVQEGARQFSPHGKGVRREGMLIKAIKKFAERYNLGPVDVSLQIDANGELGLVQVMNKFDYVYVQKEGIPEGVQALVRKYNGGYGPGISTRWIRLNHFTWEKLLADEGLLPPEFAEFR
jgi:hypothetical protein